MADPRGFLKVDRQISTPRPVYERVKDYAEVYEPLPPESVRAQASRCMDCGVPFCHTGCPLGNLIPDWNELVHRNRWKEALIELHSTNNFPEFTGKTCPAPCEASCVLTINQPAVTIKQIEQAIVDRGWAEGWIRPEPPEVLTGKRVAIVGSGPAGLAAAQQLRRVGHHVEVFERDDRPGGLLVYGIPDFKMSKKYVKRRIEQLEAEGVVFHLNAHVGTGIPAEDIVRNFDAVLLAVGSTCSRDLDVPGRELAGIERAMPFLTQQNKRCFGDDLTESAITATGKNVVIIGGGDTAADCLGTCHRQGCKSVAQLDYNPRPPEHANPTTPWPLWPKILRMTSAHEEGGMRMWQMMTREFIGDANGHVREVLAVRVQQKMEDGQRVFEEIPGSEVRLPCELVLLAIGFTGPEAPLAQAFDLELDDEGNLPATGNYMTSRPGVFTAGDCRIGASLVVWAIAEGREAARAVDEYLMKRPSPLKARDASPLEARSIKGRWT